MIDVHTHILPCLDDGAKNKAESLEILNMLQQQGVTEVALTPHYYGKKQSVDDFLRLREQTFQELQNEVPNGLKVRLGAEVHLSGVNDPPAEKLCALAIEGTKCVLVELPLFRKWSNTLFSRLEDFIYDTGYTPIVAHIERYDAVKKSPAVIGRLIEAGCLVQMNTRAFYDKRMRKFAFAMLKRNMVHFLGTDAHDTTGRKPDYERAKQIVCQAGHEKEWQRVQENMQKVLANQWLRASYKPIRKFLGIYF